METLIKQGVMGVLTPDAAEGLRLCEKYWAQQGQEQMVITSKREGTHGIGSLHPRGNAFDLRLPEQRGVGGLRQIFLRQFVERLRKHLGPDFDVVLESDHIHVEYDPK